jgi:hypothetical protein
MKKYLLLFALIAFSLNTCFAQWTNSGPEWSGSSKIKQDGNRLYLYGSRLYKSDNNGNTWEILNTPSVTFNDLLFQTGKIIAATSKGIFVSYNNGLDWISHNTGITDSANGVKCLGALGSRLFAGTLSKAYYSDNNGISWSVSSPASMGQCLGFTFSNNVVILATNIGIKRSTDNGLTYTTSNNGISGTNPVIITVLNFSNEIFCQKGLSLEIYKSTDDGQSWQLANSGITGAVTAFTINVTNSICNLSTSAGIFELNSTSGTWSLNNLSIGVTRGILHYNNNRYFALTSSSDLIKTDNTGISWEVNQINVYMNRIDKLTTTMNNQLFGISNALGGAYLFNSLSSNWSRFTAFLFDFGGTTATIASTKVNCIEYGAGNKYYIGTEGGVWSSIDSGATWLQHHTGLPITNSTFSYKTVNDLYINGYVIIAATSLGIYRSTDQANTWTQVSALNTADLHKYGSYLYATGNGVYRSNDNGLTWTAFAGATSGGPFSIISGAGGKIFTAGGSVFLYADTTANSFTSGVGTGDFFGYENLLFLYAGGKVNYYDVTISLSNLVNISDNLPCYYASQAQGCIISYMSTIPGVVDICVLGDNLWIGTAGFSTFKRSLADFGFPVANTNDEIENKEIKIYPNPTTNNFTIQNATLNGIVNIFNMQGSKVFNKKLTVKSENISIEQLSNGIYFYQITDNDGNILGQGKVIKN